MPELFTQNPTPNPSVNAIRREIEARHFRVLCQHPLAEAEVCREALLSGLKRYGRLIDRLHDEIFDHYNYDTRTYEPLDAETAEAVTDLQGQLERVEGLRQSLDSALGELDRGMARYQATGEADGMNGD